MVLKISDLLKFGHKKFRTIKFSDQHLSENKIVRNFLQLMYCRYGQGTSKYEIKIGGNRVRLAPIWTRKIMTF